MYDDNSVETDNAVDDEAVNKRICEVIDLIYGLITSPKLPEIKDLGETLRESQSFQRLYQNIIDLRNIADYLNRGELQKFVYGKGFILANLKALQSNLKHLTWQTKKIAEGDFTQKVDFLGEFSESFNSMTNKLRDSHRQMTRLAEYDVLTQVPNRLSLESFLSGAFSEAKESGGELSILIFDIDFFKTVNDKYGHKAGDAVLVAISGILSRQFRSTDIFARYGGEEFVAALPNANTGSARSIATRAIEAVAAEEYEVTPDVKIKVTVSAGVSGIQPGDRDYDDILKRSDAALYDAKHNGRNRVEAR